MSLSRILVLIIVCMLSACSQLTYYAQAAKGQWEIVNKREKISSILASPNQNPGLKQSLERIQEIRQFAIDSLGLPDNDSYQYFTDLKRKHVTWNVIAVPPYDLNPKTWCFPIAGCVSYKGYFLEASAQSLQSELAKQGYDTFLYGVSAYSTLGWFSDPVLNTFLSYDEFSLAGLIFHELAHQVVYVKDDTEFNEAFATAVEYAGLEKWILQKHDPETFNQYRVDRDSNNKITEMILQYRNQLEQAYKNTAESELPKHKRRIIKQMQLQYQAIKDNGKSIPFYDWWFGLSLNNAHLVTVATYHRLVPVFLKLLAQSENFSAFYETVRRHSKLPDYERNRWLNSIESQ